MNWAVYLKRKLYRTPLAISVTALCVLMLLNLPYDRVQQRQWKGKLIEDRKPNELKLLNYRNTSAVRFDGWENPRVLGRFAGWPEAIVIKPADSPVSTSWGTALNHNLGSLSLFAAMAFLITFGVHGAVQFCLLPLLRRNHWRHTMVAGATLLSFTGTTVGCHRIVSSGQALEAEASRYGALGYSSQLPWLLATVLPDNIGRRLHSLDSARVRAIRPALLDEITSHSTLRHIHLSDCYISRDQWRQIVSIPALTEATFQRCHFEPCGPRQTAVDWNVKTLWLDDCTGIENIESDLSHASSLQRFIVQSSPAGIQIVLDSVNQKSLEELELTFADQDPPTDQEQVDELSEPASVFVKGFAKLKRLKLEGREQSDARLSGPIYVSDCESLTTICTDQSQWWNLELNDLPQLVEVRGGSTPETPVRGSAIDLLTIHSLKAKAVPRLRRLELHSDGINTLEIVDCPSLQELTLSPERQRSYMLFDAWRRNLESGESQHRHLATVFHQLFNDQSWLQQLTTLDLGFNNLNGVDLTPILHLQRLKKLSLDLTNVDVCQLLGGQKNEVLKHFSCWRFKLKSEELNAILDQFPQLSALSLDQVQLDKLELKNRPELESIEIGILNPIDTIHIEGCPKLNNRLRMQHPMRSLRIKDGRSITELVVEHPLPPDTVLEGFRSLEKASLTGENVRDEHVKELALCQSLEELRLSSPSVSEDALKRLGSLTNLEILELPHTKVNDSVIATWSPMEYLFQLDLSYTSVTHEGIQPLLTTDRMQRLSLNHSSVDAEQVQMLSGLPRLFRLELVGIGITANCLGQLLQQSRLDVLDLSETHVAPLTIDVLCSQLGKKLMCLKVRSCNLDPADLQRLKHNHPHMEIETGVATETHAAQDGKPAPVVGSIAGY